MHFFSSSAVFKTLIHTFKIEVCITLKNYEIHKNRTLSSNPFFVKYGEWSELGLKHQYCAYEFTHFKNT